MARQPWGAACNNAMQQRLSRTIQAALKFTRCCTLLQEAIIVPKKKGEVAQQPKGIYTNPPKRGTFGMNKYTLSERQGYKGVATEYEYQHDPTDLHKARRMAEIEAHHKACVTELPFKPSNPPKKGEHAGQRRAACTDWEVALAPTTSE